MGGLVHLAKDEAIEREQENVTLFEAGIVGLSEDDRLSVVRKSEALKAWLPRNALIIFIFCFVLFFLLFDPFRSLAGRTVL